MATLSSSSKISQLSKHDRRRIIMSHSALSKVAAAVEIQRIWRGHCVRHRLCVSPMKFKYSSLEPSYLSLTSGMSSKRSDISSSSNYCSRIKKCYREHLEKCCASGSNLLPQPTFQDYCAKRIQEWYRWKKNIARRHAVKHTTQPSAVSSPSSSSSRKKKRYNKFTAAIAIQRCWRRYNDVQVYRFYRDLISFRGLGEPSLMMRCINPREAKLLDSGSGVRVKFRLGGEQFPPSVYYKVFTYHNIVDLGACSPRDYTAMSWKQPLSCDLHNKTTRAPLLQSTEGWYQRWENNGWRLVSDRLLLFQPDSDNVTSATAEKKIEFHPTKLRRKQDVVKARKRKKIAWMKKLYQNGMMSAKEGLSEEANLVIHKATEQVIAISDQKGPDCIEDRDIDALLSWTDGLNFDHYISEWSSVGTTNTSDSRHIIFSSTEDPYELRVVDTGR